MGSVLSMALVLVGLSPDWAATSQPAAAKAAELANQGRYEEAIVGFQEALKDESKRAELHLGLGLSYQEIKRYREAIQSLEDAARLAPAMVQAHYSLALLHEAVAINPGLIGEGHPASRDFWEKSRLSWIKVQRLDKSPERKKTAKKHLEKVMEELREAQ